MNIQSQFSRRRVATTVAALSVTLALNGCSSFWSVGDDKYDCPGIPRGVVCKTPRQVYELTNHRDALVTMDGDGKQKAAASSDQPDGVLGHGATVTLPQPISQPLPVLEPAAVMRIWVNSWIDQNGDLHFPGLIFTEVTPRRWAQGNIVSGVEGHVLTPVQVDDASPNPNSVAESGVPTNVGGVVVKPKAVVQPYGSSSSTSSGPSGIPGLSGAANQGPSVAGYPVPDNTGSGGQQSSPFSTNFSNTSGYAARPSNQTQSYRASSMNSQYGN